MKKQLFKKIGILMVACMLAFSFSDAQPTKGTVMAGGSAGFDSYTPKGGDAITSITVAPVAGLFFSDAFAGGISLQYASVSDGGSVFGVGPFARYYFGSSLFGQAGYTYMSTKPDAGDAVNSGQIKLMAGYSAFLNSFVALEPALYYASNSIDGNTSGSNIGISIGFQVFLGAKQEKE